MRLILLLLFLWAGNAHPLTVPEIVKKTKPACVTVLVREVSDGKVVGHGSGFFYCDDISFLGDAFAAVVTNYHVVTASEDNAKTVFQVILSDGKAYFSEIALADEEHDLALILLGSTKASEHPFIHARFHEESPKSLEEGQSVVVIGTPLNPRLFGTVSTGIIAGLRNDQDILQITAPISQGSSGSPVLDEDGDLVAVCEKIADPAKSENVNFAINAKYVTALYSVYHNGYHEWEKKTRPIPLLPYRPQPTPS